MIQLLTFAVCAFVDRKADCVVKNRWISGNQEVLADCLKISLFLSKLLTWLHGLLKNRFPSDAFVQNFSCLFKEMIACCPDFILPKDKLEGLLKPFYRIPNPKCSNDVSLANIILKNFHSAFIFQKSF